MTKDTLPTVWPADPHTLAKHQILRYYLQAWFPILSKLAGSGEKEAMFIDGFAGPGEYQGGEPGSPVIALEAALEHSQEFPTPVHFIFVEQRPDRYEHLCEVLQDLSPKIEASPHVVIDSVRQGDCDQELRLMMQQYEEHGREFGPTLAFLDQFGYGEVSMDLIRQIMRWPHCEVFSYLNARDLNRWMPDLTKAPTLDRAFGDDRWRQALETPEKNRRLHLLSLYESALHELGRVAYVQRFSMFDRGGQLLYWLLFCTNHLLGLYEMKRSMWKVNKQGRFGFSDRDDPSQLRLLEDEYSQKWLSERLAMEFAGQEKLVGEIKEYVWTRTPCYLFKTALEKLKSRGEIEVKYPSNARSRRGFGWDDISVRFLSAPGGEAQASLFE